MNRFDAALAALGARFDERSIDYCLGGSAMLSLRGLPVEVGDLDFVVDGRHRAAVVEIASGFGPITMRAPSGLWRSGWMCTGTVGNDANGIGFDVIGDLALSIGDAVARFPVAHDACALVGGRPIPLASLEQWYHLYTVHAPGKAELIRGVATTEAIAAAATTLGLHRPPAGS